MSVLGLRKEICEGHLRGGVHAVLGKIITKQLSGDFRMGRRWLLLGTQVDERVLGLRKGICQGHLGGVSTPSQGKLLPAITRGFLG